MEAPQMTAPATPPATPAAPAATPQAPAAAAPAEGAPPAAPAEATPGEDALGDAGKKALDTMKAERNAAKAEAKAATDQLAALKAAAEGKQAEHEANLAAQKVKDEALAAANDRILKAEVRAAAAAKLADPKDALLYIDLKSFEVGADGEVDGAAVAAAIDQLIKNKPYLAAQGKRFQGDADGGARTDANTPSQLTRDDMSRMSPEQIDKAHSEGRFDDLVSGKQ